MKLKFDIGNDTSSFLYIAGIYLGFGVILAGNLTDIGRKNDGFMETKWNYQADISLELFVFGLASYAKLMEQDSPQWIENLAPEIRNQIVCAMIYLNKNPSQLLNKNKFEIYKILHESYIQYKNNEIKEAVSTLQKIIYLITDESLNSVVNNNIGYYLIRLEEYEKSLSYFKNSIQVNPDFGYAYDNLGYALIQLGNLTEGKNWLDKALLTGTNDIAYSYRNLALYHQAKGEFEATEDLFLKAFTSATNSVDLLEYHYSDFLYKKGDTAKGMEYLLKAVEKGEPEAIRKLEEIKE